MLDQAVADDLSARWQALAQSRPHLRIYDAAEHLAVSEGELLLIDSSCRTVRLRPDWAGLLARVETLGNVMALTRNRAAVHERHGVYRNVSVNGPMGLVVGEDIDLRLFLGQWKHAFAVIPFDTEKRRPSLQFFDAAGRAVHKIHATPATDIAAWHALVAAFAADPEAPAATFQPAASPKPPRADSEIDVAALRDGWRALKDTHDFFGLLRKLGAARLQAMRLAGDDLALELRPDAVRRILESASAAGVPVMVFVGNDGCIQIHSGAVNNLKTMGEWFNVLDPAFNLHLRETLVASAWLVRKPTVDGVVTSIEAYDADGGTIAMIFGKRKPGEPERADWQMLTTILAAT